MLFSISPKTKRSELFDREREMNELKRAVGNDRLIVLDGIVGYLAIFGYEVYKNGPDFETALEKAGVMAKGLVKKEIDDLLARSINYGYALKAVAFGMEGRQTRAGLVGGITYAAHAVFDDPNEQADMEVLGGRVLMADGGLFAAAVRLAREQRLVGAAAALRA